MPRPISATIHPAALQHNLARCRLAAPESKVWAVVKANAYGHGIERVFEAFRSADGAVWSKLLFTRTSKRQSANGSFADLGDVELRATPASVQLLSDTMSQNRLMLVTTWKTLQQLAFDLEAFKRMHVGGWGIQLSPFTDGDDPIVVIKYDSRPLRELAGVREQWAAPDKFDPDGKLGARLRKIFDGAKAGDDPLGKLAQRIDAVQQARLAAAVVKLGDEVQTVHGAFSLAKR